MKYEDFMYKNWQITRQIIDRLSNQMLHYVGQAIIKDGIYHEHGQLQFPDGTFLKSRRHYNWIERADGIEVRFTDGSAFHSIKTVDGRAKATHLCGKDHYIVQYDFTNWPLWRSVWQVTGPRKDYEMTSEYQELK